MGVYIPDMKLPSSCLACDIPVRVQPCPMDHDNVSNYKTSRHPDCPLIPVPPHGRLGDMDAIARKIRRFGDYVDFTKDEIAGWFENGDFETIIPAEEGKE